MTPLKVEIEVVGRQFFSLFGGELMERQLNSACADTLKELGERVESAAGCEGSEKDPENEINRLEIGKLVSKLIDTAHRSAPKTDMFTVGTLTTEDGDVLLSYDESEVTGMEGAETVIRIGADGTVSLNRCGSVMTNLVFKRHERVICAFEGLDQPGMPVCVYTRDLKIARTLTTGRVTVDYFVQIGGVNGEHDRIVVTWKPHKEAVSGNN
ncbi:MAG: DUF1934 domain-containing protein [Clostridia bacterium]|nr:DUF1934 domain-containing protein [Clostridia bacterium]